MDDCLRLAGNDLAPDALVLHRHLQRHGISRSPEMTGDKEPKRKYPIGYFHIDIAEVQTAEGKLRLFVAIDRTRKFAFVDPPREAGKTIAAQFPCNLIAAVPMPSTPF